MNQGILEARELARRGGQFLAGAAPLAALEEYGRARLERWRAHFAPEAAATAAARMTPGDSWLAARERAIEEALPVAPGEAEQLLAAAASGRGSRRSSG